MKNVCLLGATGSIGTQTLDIIRESKEFCLKAFSFGENVTLAKEIIKEFHPSAVCVKEEKNRILLQQEFPQITFLSGEEGLIHIATYECECPIVVNALVGSIGLLPTYQAIQKGRDIYLANKETLVIGGKIIMEEAKKHNVQIIPLDSEHSAIYQLIDEKNKTHINQLLLTASGGSLRDYAREELNQVTKEIVLHHPNWKMGQKITVDSATMMNKGFEVIEAHHLFQIPVSQIQVLVHRDSIVHSMVEFQDHSICAQLASPDMHLPIHYALYGKNHKKCDIIEALPLEKLHHLTFEKLDHKRFPLVQVACAALTKGGIYPCILNAANEKAVELFLQEKIPFVDIEKIILEEINDIQYGNLNEENPTIEKLLEVDQLVKNNVEKKRKVG